VIVRIILRATQQRARLRAAEDALYEQERAAQALLDAECARELAEAKPKLTAQPVKNALRIIDDRYTIIGRLGTGDRCTVHEVERLDDNQRLALKLVRVHADVDLMARFARGALNATEDLVHPNVLPLIDVGISDGQLYTVMPIVDGVPLPLQRSRYGETDWAMWILAQIASGLAALHERGVVHRDLDPGNVLVASGVAQLTDYGLGMPGDASPSKESDVYAFGKIACELLTGALPADGDDARLPPLIMRCLDRDPSMRPTAAELARALAPTA
jgi:serine/threonine protein kinase